LGVHVTINKANTGTTSNGDTNFVPGTSPVLYQVVRGVIDVTFSPTNCSADAQFEHLRNTPYSLYRKY
jgi:hypothetical protein